MNDKYNFTNILFANTVYLTPFFVANIYKTHLKSSIKVAQKQVLSMLLWCELWWKKVGLVVLCNKPPYVHLVDDIHISYMSVPILQDTGCGETFLSCIWEPMQLVLLSGTHLTIPKFPHMVWLYIKIDDNSAQKFVNFPVLRWSRLSFPQSRSHHGYNFRSSVCDIDLYAVQCARGVL